jgi:endonuclease/exonuclease/phosphatase family metal-dependent hydrolase
MSVITEGMRLKLMTYNIGGGRKDFGSALDGVVKVIQKESPDILVLQEAVEWLDAEQCRHDTASDIANALGYMKGRYFGATLSMQEYFHPGKATFVHARAHGWQEWRQGNAILSRWNFAPLEDHLETAEPRNILLFRSPKYEGNRDTESRCALLARIKTPTVSLFAIGTHLSTLVGERGGSEREIPGKAAEAQKMRFEQTRHLLDLMREHMLKTGELVFLMGDFNATVNEACIADVLETEAGFVRLVPEKDDIPTHRFKVKEPIDHIFVYPAARLVDYQCRIVDTPLAHQASDHLPVVAEVSVI